MRANAVGTRENIIVIDKAEFGGMTVEVLEYQKLLGTTNINSAVDMYYMAKQNIRARQIAVYLN